MRAMLNHARQTAGEFLVETRKSSAGIRGCGLRMRDVAFGIWESWGGGGVRGGGCCGNGGFGKGVSGNGI